MNIREVSISRLREYENNPRNNDLAVEKVKHSIERFGFLFPVVVDVNFVIVCGHTRVRACREMGITSVPCIIADDLTEEQINLFRLVDNKTSEYSDWDFEKLKKELSLVDLTLEKNQLLLERFELSSEAFDIEPEQAEIKIPAFNFMGVNDRKPRVETIKGEAPVAASEEPAAESFIAEEIASHEYPVSEDHDSDDSVAVAPVAGVVSSKSTEDTKTEEAPKKKAPTTFCQFRFGDVAFFISQVELDKMNEKYAEYIDSGACLKGSFASYLLEGVK